MEKIDIVQYTSNRLIINQITSNSKYFKIDSTAGRLHTSVTTLKKELRMFLRVDEQELKEIDIKNCQPLVSLILFDLKLRLDYGIAEKLEDEIKKYNIKIDIPYMFSKFDELSKNDDAQLYFKIVTAGRFYSYLAQLYNIKYPNIKITEKEFKLKVITCLFSPSNWDSKVTQLIKDIFPSIMEAFDLLKIGFKKTKNGKGNMKRRVGDPPCLLAITLQTMEAELVLNRIVPEIISKYPDTPIITIHDAILTAPEYKDVVFELIENQINNITNHF